MTGRRSAFSTTTGTKIVIGITGLLVFAFLVVHLLGNLIVFMGPGAFNGYAHTLAAIPLTLLMELGLAAIFLIHVYKAVVNWFANRQARPVGYYQKKWAGKPSRKSVASSTMIYTGFFTLFFVVLHLKAFRFGPETLIPGTQVRDLYALEMKVFADPTIVAFYTVSMVILGFHLWHAFSSAFQSLGADHTKYTPALVVLGRVLAVVIAGGFLAIPLLVHFRGA
ncbi:MAG TPA: succinate dehydrogenase cytochrome b subunit [Armatimonadota bacterium]|jgi:succinate dehydrogenase / fumarate reductase cytochrome b subunit